MADGAPYASLFDGGVLGLQASDAFEGGVLLGRTPQRKIGADVGGIRERVAAAAPEVARVAAGFDTNAAQLAIAWCLADERVGNVLFGASRPEQLEANLGAIELATLHGRQIRAALAHLQCDTDVSPDGRWMPAV